MNFINRNSNIPQKLGNLPSSCAEREKILREIKTETNSAKKLDQGESLMLEGLLAACAPAPDIDAMHACFANALSCSPNDKAILRNYARALFQNHLYAQAIEIMQGLEKLDCEDEALMGQACQALGLSGKARQFLKKTDACNLEMRCSTCAEDAIKCVLNSFDEDKEIWQSLSTR